MNSDLAEVEALLKSLSPADAQIDRDRLLCAVGARAENRRVQRVQRIWQASAAAAVLLSISLVCLQIAKSGGANGENSTAGPSEVAQDSERDSDLASRMPSALSFQKNPTLSTAWSFSQIHSVDAWSREALEEKGILVTSWKHIFQSEDPPVDWAQITFDRSNVLASRGVVMTAWIVADEGDTLCAFRTDIDGRETDDASLIVMLRDKHRLKSYVDILIWNDAADGAHEASGYRLSAQRISELTSGDAAEKRLHPGR